MEQLEFHISEAESYFNQTDYQQALEHSNAVLAIDANNVYGHLFAGLSYHYLIQYPKAIEHFKQCLNEVQKNPDVWELYAQSLSLNEQPNEADVEYANANNKYPNNSSLSFSYGYFLVTRAKYEDAIRWLNQAEQLGNQSEKLYFYRGVSYYNLDQYSNATPDLEKVLQLSPEDAEAPFVLGNVYFNQHKLEKAIELYSRVLFYNPDHKKAVYERLMCRINLKDHNGYITNQQAAQQDADKLLPYIHEFIRITSKEGEKLTVATITISETGNMNFDVN